ncbi:DUF2397 family protein [Actinomadura welshii]|uniref:DUF2397 family protein n=1 Tax=Actinomadura welshii TaxID=3103817 RepID=UPI0003AD26D8|nr:DUF2397 family protein [Actinomadura madurae]
MNRLDSLAANASAFMSGLQRTIELQDVDEEAFLVYKDRLIAYLERFVSELVVEHHDIAATLRALPPERVADPLALAARREVADAVPDRATVPDEQADQPVAVSAATGEKLALGERRWSGLWSWFVGGRGHPCQADLSRTRARKAIPDLLASVDELRDRLQDAKQRIAELETAIRRLDGDTAGRARPVPRRRGVRSSSPRPATAGTPRSSNCSASPPRGCSSSAAPWRSPTPADRGRRPGRAARPPRRGAPPARRRRGRGVAPRTG